MSNLGRFILATCAALGSTVATRTAWAAGTCSFDAATGIMDVQMTGGAILRPQPDSILMDGAPCGAATITTVDRIQVTGSGDLRLNTSARPFAPGRTPESDGASEIEIDVQVTFGTIRFELDATPDVLVLTDTQGDFFGDGDLDDFTFSGISGFVVSAGRGDDVIDCSGLTMRSATLMGGAGDDDLRGGRVMFGDVGNDILTGATLGTSFYDGTGDDILIGGPGNDRFFGDDSSNGADQIIGGAGLDTISYSKRTTDLQIAMDGVSESGELVGGVPVEGDRIAADVENAEAGPGNDILIGNDLANRLLARGGNDLLDGVGGDDHLDGGEGGDDITGGDGNDRLLGLQGNDFLDGGAGNDTLVGQEGDDDMVGGDGNDHMTGSFGNDSFLGGEGDDGMFGGPGNDRLEGGNGFDTYRGNAGSDHLEAPADGITEDIRCGVDIDTFVAGPEDIIDKGCLP